MGFNGEVSRVQKETEYRPPCVQQGNEGILDDKAGRGAPKKAEMDQKRRLCAGCLVRLECLTDAVNGLLEAGKPDRNIVGGFRAGLTNGEQVELAIQFYDAGQTSVTIDDIEPHL